VVSLVLEHIQTWAVRQVCSCYRSIDD